MVWLNDGDVINSKGELIQCLELKPIVNPKMLNKYFELMNRKKWVLCQDDLKTIDSFIIYQFSSRLSVERMEQKSKQIIIEFEELFGNVLIDLCGNPENLREMSNSAFSTFPSLVIHPHKK